MPLVRLKPEPQLIHGDARKFLPLLPDRSIDFVFTDPPYGHNNNDGDLIANWEKALGSTPSRNGEAPRPIANDGKDADDLIQWALNQFDRLLSSGGCVCCCCGGGGPDPQFARWSLWMDKAIGFKHMVVWDKGPIGLGWHYRRSYETVLVGEKKGGACRWYDETNSVENIIRPGHNGIRKIIPNSNEHPTLKPVGLAEHFILLHTKPGDLVLDPFMGEGTTGVACLRTGRRFIGIEIERRWYDRAVLRIAGKRPEKSETREMLV